MEIYTGRKGINIARCYGIIREISRSCRCDANEQSWLETELILEKYAATHYTVFYIIGTVISSNFDKGTTGMYCGLSTQILQTMIPYIEQCGNPSPIRLIRINSLTQEIILAPSKFPTGFPCITK